MSSSLELFHDLVQRWFGERYGTPTEVQEHGWARIAAGNHLIASAPTGTGKTLAAFLWAINQLLSGAWPRADGVSVLYVSPLKALNNDISRNLEEPLQALRSLAERVATGTDESGQDTLAERKIRVATRSGDTPDSERQRMVKQPPDILVTTPESLNLLLSSPRAREILRTLRCVIIDEIHAVAGTKRGTHLMTAVERLTLLSGEFQRIGMSATVQPLEGVARFLGGYRPAHPEAGSGPGLGADVAPEHGLEPRPVEVVSTGGRKRRVVGVSAPPEPEEAEELWPALARECLGIIRRNRSTLFFTTNRRNAEKLSLHINREANEELAYSHHGSLSRELRFYVEEQLKAGSLRAIVATTSLELGIDVGEIDEVVMIGSPLSASQTVQMVGRACHRVDAESRGVIYPLHGKDYLDAAVLAQAAQDAETEPIHPIRAPLDVLAQVIVSMVSVDPWRAKELRAFLRRCAAYRELGSKQFEAVLHMLSGETPGSGRSLPARVLYDRESGELRGAPGALRTLYHSGGTIPDRGYYTMRSADGGARVGELDEEFVWERRIGDVFVLGSRRWQITAISDRDVEVRPADNATNALPFWRAEPLSKSFFLAERTLRLLGRINEADTPTEGVRAWAPAYGLTEAATERLAEHLQAQTEATGTRLPDRHNVVLERYRDPTGRDDAVYAVLHTMWGGTVNRPCSLLLAATVRERMGQRPDLYVDNECIMLRLSDEAEWFHTILTTLPTLEDQVAARIAEELNETSFFGARFRENAGRALLLPRAGFDRRTPLWMTRMRARELLAAVSDHPDFPIVVETWRTCLEDEIDLSTLARLLGELRSGAIQLSLCDTSAPSPFARNVLWQQTNLRIYEDDTPARSPGGDAVRRAVRVAALRPELKEDTVRALLPILQRLRPGYAPETFQKLWLWVEQRVAIPSDEWRALAEQLPSELRDSVTPLMQPSAAAPSQEPVPTEALAEVSDGAFRLLRIRLPQGGSEAVVTSNRLPGLLAAGESEQSVELLAQWLSYYGPVLEREIATRLGLSAETVSALLAELESRGNIATEVAVEGWSEPAVCETENLERLLRLQRRHSAPELTSRPLEELPLFLASLQGLLPDQRSHAQADALTELLDQLSGYVDRAELWESAFFPARLQDYRPAWLDRVLADEEHVWFGAGERHVGLAHVGDLSLLREALWGEQTHPAAETDPGLLPAVGRFSPAELAQLSGLSLSEARARLWQLAWAGMATSDSFGPVRRGVQNGFPESRNPSAGTAAEPRSTAEESGGVSAGSPAGTGAAAHGGSGTGAGPYAGTGAAAPGPAARRGRRRSAESRRRGEASESRWRRLPAEEGASSADADPVAAAELGKERARLVLSRYGVVSRELLEAELPPLRWSALFESFRLLELAGEALGGRFIEGLSGPQFADPQALPLLERLGELRAEEPLYWMSARDPASPCGRARELQLPSRIASNHLVFAGTTLVLASSRSGQELRIPVGADHRRLPAAVELHCTMLLRREVAPLTRLRVETINGTGAARSPFASLLLQHGFTAERSALVRWAGYR